jgi:hypothetical protein
MLRKYRHFSGISEFPIHGYTFCFACLRLAVIQMDRTYLTYADFAMAATLLAGVF